MGSFKFARFPLVLILALLGVAVLGAVVYFGAGRQSGAGAPENAQAPAAVNANDRLLALPVNEQNALLISYIRNAGGRCLGVSRSLYQGRTGDGRAIWSVRCHRGVDWSLGFDASGDWSAAACTSARAAATCWRPLQD